MGAEVRSYKTGSRNKRLTQRSSFSDSILSAVEVMQMSAGVLLLSSCCSAALNCWLGEAHRDGAINHSRSNGWPPNTGASWMVCVVSSVSQLRGWGEASVNETLNHRSADTLAHAANTELLESGWGSRVNVSFLKLQDHYILKHCIIL